MPRTSGCSPPHTTAAPSGRSTSTTSPSGERSARGPVRVPAERAEQPVLLAGPGRYADPGSDHAVLAVRLLPFGEPPGTGAYQVGVQPGIGADRDREVPGVYQVVGEQLADVLGRGGLAEGQVDGPVECAGSGYRLGGLGSAGGRCGGRIRAQYVPVEAFTNVLDRRPGEQRYGPPLLAHDVVHQRPDVPVGARRGYGPLVRPDLPDPVGEAGERMPVQLDEVHVHSYLGEYSHGCLRSWYRRSLISGAMSSAYRCWNSSWRSPSRA